MQVKSCIHRRISAEYFLHAVTVALRPDRHQAISASDFEIVAIRIAVVSAMISTLAPNRFRVDLLTIALALCN